jgi:type VI secretion system protein VasD
MLRRSHPVFATLLLLAGCASGPPTSVHLTLRAAAGLNPDAVGLPNPVQTHVYLLRAAETFGNTDYFQLADHEHAVLGADLLAQDDEFLRPGQSRELTLPVPAGTKVIAVTAAFRNIDGGTWRATTPLHGTVVVDLGAQSVQVVYSK